MTRTCTACGAPMVPRPGEKPSRFARRQSCNYLCGSTAGAEARRQAVAASRCAICGASPCATNKRGRLKVHCGSPECLSASLRGGRQADDVSVPWPKAGAVVTIDFRPHEVLPPAEGMFRMARPDSRSLTGSSAAWAAGV